MAETTEINREELEICKRRGHLSKVGWGQGWAQCQWCGLWLREVRTMEEREDPPPENERNQLPMLRKALNIKTE